MNPLRQSLPRVHGAMIPIRYALLATAILVAVSGAATAQVSTSPADSLVVATVADRPITLRECRFMARVLNLADQVDDPAVRDQVLETLVRRELLLEEAERLEISKHWIFKGNLERHRMNLLNTAYEYWEIAKTASVPPEEVEAVVAMRDRELGVEQIVLADSTEAARARERMAAGAPLAELLAEFEPVTPPSQHLASVAASGALGTLQYGQLPEPLNRAVMALSQGEVTEPVRTVIGWHVLRVTGERPRFIDADAEFRAVEREMLQRKVAERKRQLTEELAARYRYELKPENVRFFCDRLGRAIAGDDAALREPVEAVAETLLCDRVYFSDEEAQRPLFTSTVRPFTIEEYLYRARVVRTDDHRFELRRRYARMERDAGVWFRTIALARLAEESGYADDDEFKRRLATYEKQLTIEVLHDELIDPRFNPSLADIEAYYNAHRDRYQSLDRLWVARYIFDAESDARLAGLALETGRSPDALAAELASQGVLVAYDPPDEPITPFDEPELFEELVRAETPPISMRDDGRFELRFVADRDTGRGLGLSEITARVYADMRAEFGNQLLDALVEEMRERYPVVIHEEQLARLAELQ